MAHHLIIHSKLMILKPEISLPNWVPGSYLIRDFARHITHISARCNGKAQPLTQTSKKLLANPCPQWSVGNLLHCLRIRLISSRLVPQHRARLFRRRVSVLKSPRTRTPATSNRIFHPAAHMADSHHHTPNLSNHFSDGLIRRAYRPPG